jgi:hypothetical protein
MVLTNAHRIYYILPVGVNVYDKLLEILECGENVRNESIYSKNIPFRVFFTEYK